MSSTVMQHLEFGYALNWHRAEHIFAIFTRISLAAILFLRYWPSLTMLDVYKISVVISMSVMTFITLNSYATRTNAISYTREAILGPKIFGAPIEELFVVALQTSITALFCILFTRRTNYNFTPNEETDLMRKRKRNLGFVILFNLFAIGLPLWLTKGMYLGLLLIWYTPLLAILWDIAYTFLLRMPLSNMLVPVVLPTLFFCWVGRGKGRLVDERAEMGLSWNELAIEEVVFFLLNNIFVEWGLVAVDYAFAILSQLPPFSNYI